VRGTISYGKSGRECLGWVGGMGTGGSSENPEHRSIAHLGEVYLTFTPFM